MACSRENYRIGLIPQKSGVYVYRDSFFKIIYIGKAKNLRKRIAYYFQSSRLINADPKLRSLIKSIAFFEFFIVKTDSEALLLESRFIKEYNPTYNILLRDDKRFFMVKINMKEIFPRLLLTRLKKDDGANYFGPFPKTSALKKTIEYLNRYFNLRSCSPFHPSVEDRKYCHKHVLRYCSSPCDKNISIVKYNQKIHQVFDVLNGKVNFLVKDLKKKMNNYASKENFEKAALIRDIIDNLSFLFINQRNFVRARIKNKRENILEELQKKLNLPFLPYIIEGFDNSHFQGQYTVSSMVRFINGKPHTKSYRYYKIKTVDGIDDFASMYEVIYRRYKRLLAEKNTLPNLILIDGGKGQLSSAYAALKKLGLNNLSLIGLAKRQEEIFIPNQKKPIILVHDIESLKLLQHIRDESHRFAISFHRNLRNKFITNSLLDDIPYIGVKRKQKLLETFGSVQKLRTVTPESITEKIAGINLNLAIIICNFLKNT